MTLQGFFDVIQTTLDNDANILATDMTSTDLTLVVGTDTVTATYSATSDTVELQINSKPTETTQV